MTAHQPPWCIGPPVCTAGQEEAPGLRPLHRGQPERIGGVTASLVQEPGGEPKVAVTTNGWAHSRTAELNLASNDVLIAALMRLAETARQHQIRASGPTPANK